ncbi:hypothetical protein [Gorillibacterium massiliense]|uniref:hypothetical protein n=1 Tax=Gorillibacterium massiliense TaxID=1280390 RepID=UPI000592897B|nr:hypothetical protein [Gorillibacterium massiliense]
MANTEQVMRYGLLAQGARLAFVEMPETHMYQLAALIGRLHKEIDKLTAGNKPDLPVFVAECDNLEVADKTVQVWTGLDYINELEKTFAAIRETEYPLISLLTEIRALQAQLEQWYEEAEEARAL